MSDIKGEEVKNIAVIKSGETFGEIEFFRNGPYSHSIVAGSDECEVVSISTLFLRTFLPYDNLLAAKFYKYNAENLLRVYHSIQTNKFPKITHKPISLFQEKIYKKIN